MIKGNKELISYLKDKREELIKQQLVLDETRDDINNELYIKNKVLNEYMLNSNNYSNFKSNSLKLAFKNCAEIIGTGTLVALVANFFNKSLNTPHQAMTSLPTSIVGFFVLGGCGIVAVDTASCINEMYKKFKDIDKEQLVKEINDLYEELKLIEEKESVIMDHINTVNLNIDRKQKVVDYNIYEEKEEKPVQKLKNNI